MNDAINEIKELLKLFRIERIIYVTISVTAFISLISCAIFILYRNTNSYPAILGLFCTGGGVGYSAGRLLKMWSDAIEYITKNSRK